MSEPPPRPRKARPPPSAVPVRREKTKRGAAAILESDSQASPWASACPSTEHQKDLASRKLPSVTVAAAQALQQSGAAVAAEFGARGPPP